jgi:hypothetical protein
MQFAVVDLGDGKQTFMTVDGIRNGRLHGRHAWTWEPVAIEIERAVHMGLTGDEPAFVVQWTMPWIEQQLRAAGRHPESQDLRIAANPKGGKKSIDPEGSEDDDESDMTEGEKELNRIEHARLPPELAYQSGKMKWTTFSRKKRKKEQEAFLAAGRRAAGGGWTRKDRDHAYGYQLAKTFINDNRKLIYEGDNLFWSMCFALLTANEGTAKAEAHLAGFAKSLRGKIAAGAELKPGIITKQEFMAAWEAGMAEKKWEGFNNILGSWLKVKEGLAYANRDPLHPVSDGDLRELLVMHFALPAGLGVTKFSFALECCGQNVACLDRWMLRAMGAHNRVQFKGGLTRTADMGGYIPAFGSGDGALSYSFFDKVNKQIEAHTEGRGKPIPLPPWKPFSDGAYILSEWGASNLGCRAGGKKKHLAMSGCLKEYEWWEGRLKDTEFYRDAKLAGDPNPLSQAQWMTWEDIMRTHPKLNLRVRFATHSPLWAATHGSEALRRAKIEWGRSIVIRRMEGDPRLNRPQAELRSNPKGIGRVFEEALAWKRKEVNNASPEAKALARKLSESALVDFSRA